ncbi:CUB and sushi domain-containing protein 2-like [Diadema setosum]|uniref:CUB and sushi domain-containing protein 2-like n=1 Tax=Diadema setosum TaxID=31175 RepID=UPI003B3AA77E
MIKFGHRRVGCVAVALLVALVSCIDSLENVCNPPRSYPNADAQWSDRTLGAYVTYTCRDGYQMAGPAETVVKYCDENGRWRSKIRPACTPIQCTNPKTPLYGNVTYAVGSGEYGSVVAFSCDEYYEPMVTSSGLYAQCQANGTWSMNCDAPEDLHGTVIHVNDHVCLYYSGADDEPLNWTASQQVCADHGGSLVKVSDGEIQALIVEHLEDINDNASYWIGASELQTLTQSSRLWGWQDGSPVRDTFWGNDEPTSDTNAGNSTGQCVAVDPALGYEWNDLDCSLKHGFICQFGQIGVCSDPGAPLHGSRTELACQGEVGGFISGCLVKFSCDPGYRLAGPSSSTCDSLGRWTEELPTCGPRRCGVPPPKRDMANVQSDEYRGIAVYQCGNESRPTGGDVFVYCKQDGAWSQSAVQCQDWTFIGVVGALGILLLVAFIVIFILAAVRGRNIRAATSDRPLIQARGQKHRSDLDPTYYSIRYPATPFSQPEGSHLEFLKRKLSDVDKGERRQEFTQNVATYNVQNVPQDDGNYLEPIKPAAVEGAKMDRLDSGEYENPLSPKSCESGRVGDKAKDAPFPQQEEESKNSMLNDYIIVLPDPPAESSGAADNSVSVAGSVEGTAANHEVKVEAADQSSGVASEEKKNSPESPGGGKDVIPSSQNGLQVPSLNYDKNNFGSTVEL